jgi:hypothetical protein
LSASLSITNYHIRKIVNYFSTCEFFLTSGIFFGKITDVSYLRKKVFKHGKIIKGTASGRNEKISGGTPPRG